ncbi:MAG: M48 family metallopeptidase [Nocardiaceae bacterium]|nr:M48 family metallopeptidase [Nocardiaceae bacterium]
MPARHRAEIPLLVIAIGLMAVSYPSAIWYAYTHDSWTSNTVLFVFIPLLIFIVRGLTVGSPQANGVKLSQTQFPEAYQMVVQAASRFGMRQVPDAYVVLGNGVVNAFSVGHGFRRYVVVHSDLFEIGGEARDPDALAFVIGHEVGHIAAGHASYWRLVGMAAVSYVPFLGSALSRAQEYTADNHGFCFRPEGAAGAIRLLTAGKYLNKFVDADVVADRASTERGFFVWLVNALASHPVNTFRGAALRNRMEHGRLMFRPRPVFSQMATAPAT